MSGRWFTLRTIHANLSRRTSKAEKDYLSLVALLFKYSYSLLIELLRLLTLLYPGTGRCLGSEGRRGLQQRGRIPRRFLFPAPGFVSGRRPRLSGDLTIPVDVGGS